MKRWACATLLLCCLFQTACDRDPARSVKIGRASLGFGVSDAAPMPAWRPEICPPPPEPTGGPSALNGIGACPFQQQGAATCVITDDDLMMEAHRAMPGDALFTVYLSIENFTRGGDNVAELMVSVENSDGLYRWATDSAHAVMAADASAVEIAGTHLPSMPPLTVAEVVVSGIFRCAPGEGTGGRLIEPAR